jgi:hypothetical protein
MSQKAAGFRVDLSPATLNRNCLPEKIAMRANTNHPRSALRKSAGGEETRGENKRWDDTCGKDKREIVPFVFSAGIVSSGALFGRCLPGTDTHSSFPSRAAHYLGA